MGARARGAPGGPPPPPPPPPPQYVPEVGVWASDHSGAPRDSKRIRLTEGAPLPCVCVHPCVWVCKWSVVCAPLLH